MYTIQGANVLVDDTTGRQDAAGCAEPSFRTYGAALNR